MEGGGYIESEAPSSISGFVLSTLHELDLQKLY